MSQKVLVMYEISQKQNYIFRTNRLIENIGASTIIQKITENPHVLFAKKGVILPKEEEKIVGGGNAIYLFEDDETATRFAKQLTSNIFRFFPGVELFLVKRSIDWDCEFLYDRKTDHSQNIERGVLPLMRDELALKKNQRIHASQQWSWGIQQVCADSGLPASALGFDRDKKKYVPRAKELVVKEEIGRTTRDIMFKESLLVELNGKYSFLEESHLENVFKDFEEAGGRGYLAVVHIDGNAMGEKVGVFLSQHFDSNDHFIEAYKRFTEEIDFVYKQAFRKMIRHLMKDFETWAPVIYGELSEEQLESMKWIIPVRPIVAAGDDISYITYGQLGIESARLFIQYLQQQEQRIHDTVVNFHASAGVAIVKHKFPFWVAYELSESLCTNAKKRLKADKKYIENKEQIEFDSSLIDWQIVSEGDFQLDLDEMRQLLYLNSDGSFLLNRPYYLQQESDSFYHKANYMTSFLHAMNTIRDTINDGTFSRAKWKGLRQIYHLGIHAVEQWKIQNQVDLTPNEFFLNAENGYQAFGGSEGNDEQSVSVAYFYDALEAMDFFIRLSEVND